MPKFSYLARTPAGRNQRGEQEAASSTALVGELRKRGWLVLDVKPVEAGMTVGAMLAKLRPSHWLAPRSSDIEVSLQQLSVMLRSGLTLLTALRSVAEFATRRSMRETWEKVAEMIQQGSGFADAMAKFRCFPHLVVHLTRVGEQTGTLEMVVNRAAQILERRRQLKAQLLTALAYPAVVFVAAIGVAVFMIVSVIPKLAVFLKALGKKLPAPTQLMLDISDAVQIYAPWVVGSVVLLTGIIIALYLWPPGRLFFDRWMLRVPIVGGLLRLSATVQFSHGMGVLLSSGVTLVEGLRTVAAMHRNRWVSQKVSETRTAVVQGSGLAEPLEKTGVFLPMLPRMVAVGESAGTLDEVLEESAAFTNSCCKPPFAGSASWSSR